MAARADPPLTEAFQPLAVRSGTGRRSADVYVGDDAMEALKNTGSSNLSVLRNRASKILRAKS